MAVDWSDDALVLGAKPFGETGAIADLMTAAHGRQSGLVRGGRGRRMRGTLEPGTLVRARWRARLDTHLGTLEVEALRSYAGPAMARPRQLAGLVMAMATAQAAIPERVPYPAVYEGLVALLDLLGEEEIWPALYARWELGLLSELGYGLDLARCAATGETDDLAYVSPRTGRAVGRGPGAPYAARLLPLPAFLLGAQGGPGDREEAAAGLLLTGHFLERRILEPHGKRLPDARGRFIDMLKAGKVPT
ncbi:DNA repair protein RecO [Futiania mangrovi]|uniref:DNA repair protein RecO n=1 Tax=Futiania mangrovi TaxID=2959716 RepID=A0A9J6PE51_9PROT|nr:DNA repair protein RecO [Futiania mangrovii]MCP1336104.1 DNA repair protein RecO [Futiania mangrovii]